MFLSKGQFLQRSAVLRCKCKYNPSTLAMHKKLHFPHSSSGSRNLYSTTTNEQQSAVPSSQSTTAPLASEKDTLEKKKKEAPNREKSKRLWKRIIDFAKPETRSFVLALVGLGIQSATSLLTPVVIGQLVDAIASPEHALESLKTTSIVLGSLFVVGGVATLGRVAVLQIAGQRIATRMRRLLFETLIKKQEVSFFDRNRTGELTNRLSTDVQVVSDTLTQTVVSGLRSLLEATGGIALLCFLSFKLTGISLSIMPALAIGAVIYGKFVKKIAKQYMDALANSTSIATEKLSHIRTVKLFTAEDREMSNYNQQIEKTFQLGKKLGIARGIFHSGVMTAANFAMLAVLFMGGLDVLAGTISIGQLSSFLLYSVYIGISISNLSSVYGDLMKTVGSSERIFELLDRKPLVNLEGKRLDQLQGKIEFRNVSFGYGDGLEALVPNEPISDLVQGTENNSPRVLDDFSLLIEPGTTVAVVGSSGSGKSTILSLLCRLYDVQPGMGEVLIDGHSVTELDALWLRSQIGVVPQEPILFATTIEENIRYGIEGDVPISIEQIEQVAKLANAHDFITQFPDGYKTMVGEHSVTLSGGQKQRIAIARAILKNPRILILDEATSALDSTVEFSVCQSLGTGSDRRTTIIIAHRLSTIKLADKIAVIHQGKVAELGTHEELMARPDSKYKALVTRQMHSGSQ